MLNCGMACRSPVYTLAFDCFIIPVDVTLLIVLLLWYAAEGKGLSASVMSALASDACQTCKLHGHVAAVN